MTEYEISEVTTTTTTNAPQYSYEWVNQQTKELPESEFSISNADDNISKNRYNNVVANNTTIVSLSNKKYVNANYVCGGRYISCQAPLSHTIEDFWTMIWEQNTPVIIMLTKYEENGKAKATPYFSETASPKKFGNFSVATGAQMYPDMQTVRRMEMQVRELVIENVALKQKRSVMHIHYMGWPDFGVPKNSKQITDMLYMAMLFRGKIKKNVLNGPPAVHCSAGLGRSGTFICLLRFYEQTFFNAVKTPIAFPFASTIAEVNEVDKKINGIKGPIDEKEIEKIVADLVLALRLERRGMVQTEDQYKYIISMMVAFYKDIYGKVSAKSKLVDIVEGLFSPTCKKNVLTFMKKVF